MNTLYLANKSQQISFIRIAGDSGNAFYLTLSQWCEFKKSVSFIKKFEKTTQIQNRFFLYISADLAFITAPKKIKNSEKAALKQFTKKSESTFENLMPKQTE